MGIGLLEIQDYSMYPDYLDQLEAMLDKDALTIVSHAHLNAQQQKEILKAWIRAQRGKPDELEKLEKEYGSQLDPDPAYINVLN